MQVFSLQKCTEESEISLFLDIGTNGEVLGNNEWLVTAACSAGPCFEGSGIRHGMRATEGAVESIKIDPPANSSRTGVVGSGKPVCISGSGHKTNNRIVPVRRDRFKGRFGADAKQPASGGFPGP